MNSQPTQIYVLSFRHYNFVFRRSDIIIYVFSLLCNKCGHEALLYFLLILTVVVDPLLVFEHKISCRTYFLQFLGIVIINQTSNSL